MAKHCRRTSLLRRCRGTPVHPQAAGTSSPSPLVSLPKSALTAEAQTVRTGRFPREPEKLNVGLSLRHTVARTVMPGSHLAMLLGRRRRGERQRTHREGRNFLITRLRGGQGMARNSKLHTLRWALEEAVRDEEHCLRQIEQIAGYVQRRLTRAML